MPYLICKICGGYYELIQGEFPEDFHSCQCGGTLKYYESMSDYVNFGIYDHDYNELTIGELNKQLDMYNTFKKDEDEYKHQIYEENKPNFFSENFVTNWGFIILTFSIVPLFFGTGYSNWIYYLISGISIILSLFYLFINYNLEDDIRNSFFQKLFIFTGIFFGFITLCLLLLLFNKEFIKDMFEPVLYNRGGLIYAYVSALFYSLGFSYLFFKNSLMEERIDLLNSDKETLYLGYYPFIFMFFIIMIAGMGLVIWAKYAHYI